MGVHLLSACDPGVSQLGAGLRGFVGGLSQEQRVVLVIVRGLGVEVLDWVFDVPNAVLDLTGHSLS